MKNLILVENYFTINICTPEKKLFFFSIILSKLRLVIVRNSVSVKEIFEDCHDDAKKLWQPKISTWQSSENFFDLKWYPIYTKKRKWQFYCTNLLLIAKIRSGSQEKFQYEIYRAQWHIRVHRSKLVDS